MVISAIQTKDLACGANTFLVHLVTKNMENKSMEDITVVEYFIKYLQMTFQDFPLFERLNFESTWNLA